MIEAKENGEQPIEYSLLDKFLGIIYCIKNIQILLKIVYRVFLYLNIKKNY